MKKVIFGLLLCLFVVIGFTDASHAKAEAMRVQVNGRQRQVYRADVEVNGFYLRSNFSPYIDENRTFVPIRELTELMGANVQWNQRAKSVTIQLREQSVTLKINSNIVYVNGVKKTLNSDSIPRLAYYMQKGGEDKTMVPLRFLSESFGFNVEWNQKDTIARISNGSVQGPTWIEDEVVAPETSYTEPVASNEVAEPTPEPTPQPTPAPKNTAGTTVVVDAGHGGKDSGAVSFDGTREKDLNLEVAKKLEAKLRSNGYNVIMTRSRDEFIGLYNRANIANDASADIFLSIHFNSAGSTQAHGIEVLYASEDDVSIKKGNQKALAQEVLNALIKATGEHSRGLKNRPDLAVLRTTEMSAALVELGFLSNEQDMNTIHSSGYLDKLATGIYNGINSYKAKYL
nr:N-acetylmuramoyl-L-alanine amidase [Peptoniphilus sp. KCTC 25270]